MALTALFLLPLLGGLLAPLAARLAGDRGDAERWVAIAFLAAPIFIVVALAASAPEGARWMARFEMPWAPALGISLVFALDGLSAALVVVAAALGILGVMISWREIRTQSGLFHLCLCWTVAAATGVFLSFDLLVFAFFWEAMLIPAFLLIALWGHGDREAAALKFLVFNAVGGLGLLAAVFALAAMAGSFTFNAFALAAAPPPPGVQAWLLAAFAVAFLVKLPAPPLHAWLPDAHTQAPTAGSVLLAGLLLKTGAYGLYRFPPMLFPDATVALAPYGLVLGAAGAVYGGLVACGQKDAKRLVAYASIAHMGVVLMALSARNELALIGGAVEMLAHSFSASALFLLIGALYERTRTRDLEELGGLQQAAPRFSAGFALFFAALLAMPGTANFVGEALVVVGLFQLSWPLALVALSTLIVSVVYATRLLKGILFGAPRRPGPIVDLGWRELVPVLVLAAGTLGLGLFPQLLAGLIGPAVEAAQVMRLP